MTQIMLTHRCASCKALLHFTDGANRTEDGQDICLAINRAHVALKLDKSVTGGQYPQKPGSPTVKVTHQFDHPPVPGQRVTGTSFIEGRTRPPGTFSGTYMGVRPSEWTGEPVHFLINGDINGVKQDAFAFLGDQ